MQRRTRNRMILAAIVLVAAAMAYPRFKRCRAWHRSLQDGGLAQLSAVPVALHPGCGSDALTLDAGYARLSLPRDYVNRARVQRTWLAVFGNSEKASVALCEPHYRVDGSPDGNYSSTRASLETLPVSQWEMFWMSRRGYREYIKRVIPKLNSLNERGICSFETGSTKGFIQYGARDDELISIALWSKEGAIKQFILVNDEDETRRRAIAECIAASFSYSVDGVPERRSLVKLISDAAEQINR